jgi:hypothetical protein
MGVSSEYDVWNFLQWLLFCFKSLVRRRVFFTNYKNMGKTESNQIRVENLVWSSEV